MCLRALGLPLRASLTGFTIYRRCILFDQKWNKEWRLLNQITLLHTFWIVFEMNIAAVNKQSRIRWLQFNNSCGWCCMQHMEKEITFQPSSTGLYQTDSHTSSWTSSVGPRKGTATLPSSVTQTGRAGCKGESLSLIQNHWSFANAELNNATGDRKRRLAFHLACGALYCAFWNSAGGRESNL